MVNAPLIAKGCKVLTVVLYWGPLSDTTVSGVPCSANTDLRWLITAADVVEFSFLTIGFLL